MKSERNHCDNRPMVPIPLSLRLDDINSEDNADNLAYQQGYSLLVSNLQEMTNLLSPATP